MRDFEKLVKTAVDQRIREKEKELFLNSFFTPSEANSSSFQKFTSFPQTPTKTITLKL